MEPSFHKMGRQHDVGVTTVVGFEDDARRLIEQLMGGKKQLQVISVVGMAGLGKTTLVKRIFNEPSIVYHFYVRAWTTVTQEPKKGDLLSGILKSGFDAEIKDFSDMELSVNLKRRLSGQRYLVVMDDIWDVKDWNDWMLCFPDDNVGSRIVITSRLANLPLQIQYQHPLRFLTEKESWDLLHYKVFLEEKCPLSLIEIGAHIARKCQGLPLSIVVIAGILASDTTLSWWSQVAHDMSSITSNGPEQYMETLVLSYNHLPDHLKPCFLYFAAFPEDYEIPAWKLILLWVSEGFIKIQDSETNLEDVAACYLNDLISRSLVIISKRRSNGGIKACIVHDALRELCIKKAGEANFLHQMPTSESAVSKLLETLTTFGQMPMSESAVSKLLETLRTFGQNKKKETRTTSLVQRLHSQEVDEENFIMSLHEYFHLGTPSAPMVQTILCCNGSGNSYANKRYQNDYLFDVLRKFQYLSVMDLSRIGLSNIPTVIGSLLKLRYLALCIKAGDNHPDEKCTLSKLIYKLKYLETLIVDNRNINFIRVPKVNWMSDKLRHLILKGNIDDEIPKNTTGDPIGPFCTSLPHLQTLLHPSELYHYRDILLITGNLRKLGIKAPLYPSCTMLEIPNLDKLEHLENLSLQNELNHDSSLEDKFTYKELSSPNMFPSTLKKLTLVSTHLKWDEMQKIGMLPNLEVLKLQFDAFCGEHWETSDGGFRQLKHLAFKFIKIVRWSAYTEQFPNLRHLKLEGCYQLKEIPIGIGDIYSLEMIEIRNCNPAVVQSAHEIKEDQLNKGNDMLKISIFQA